MDITNERLKSLLRAVQKEDVTFKQLVAATENVIRSAIDIDETEVELVLSAINDIKWTKFKSKAKKAYGTEHDNIKEILGQQLLEAVNRFDLTNNKVASTVKTGGDMIAGRALIDIYISYKNTNNEACSLGAYQVIGSDPIKWRVCSYVTGKAKQERLYQEFDYDDVSSAGELFHQNLKSLINH